MNKEVPQAPYATMGSTPSHEGKYIIDRPLRVKSCARCWQPLRFKDNRLYCPTCKKFRTAKTSHWIDHKTKLEYLDKSELEKMLEMM